MEVQAQLIDALVACALDILNLAKIDRNRMSAAGLGVVVFLVEAALRKAGIKSSKAPLRGFATLEVNGVGAPPLVFPTPMTTETALPTGVAVSKGDRVIKRLLEIKSSPKAFDNASLQLARSLLTMAIIHHAVHYHVADNELAVADLHSRKHEPVTYDFSGAVAFYDKSHTVKAVRHWQLGLPWPAPFSADRAASTADDANADAAFAPFWYWHPGCSVTLRVESLPPTRPAP